jgi:NADH dehydrogenase (ubiquinone) flavoprotein 2
MTAHLKKTKENNKMSDVKGARTSAPETFEFTKEHKDEVKVILSRYPKDRSTSAVMPLLDMAQRQNGGWLSPAAIEHVAEILQMAPIRVYEVASFYSMYNLKPVGKYHIQVCGTTPCMLSGAEDIVKVCETHLGITLGETTADGKFTLTEVECLGACVNAPMIQINDDYYTDLTPEICVKILENLNDDKEVKAGSQTGRQGAAPSTGPTTLKSKGV